MALPGLAVLWFAAGGDELAVEARMKLVEAAGSEPSSSLSAPTLRPQQHSAPHRTTGALLLSRATVGEDGEFSRPGHRHPQRARALVELALLGGNLMLQGIGWEWDMEAGAAACLLACLRAATTACCR